MSGTITVSTDRQIAALPAPSKRTWALVEGCPGLRIAISSGRKGIKRTFIYRYKTPEGKQQQTVIGRYPDLPLRSARAKWLELRDIRQSHGYVKAYIAHERRENATALQGATTQTERDAYTVSTLIREHVEYQSARIKTWRETERNLTVYVEPVIGTRPAHMVKRADIVDILDGLTVEGKAVQANRVLAAVRKGWNWAIEREKGGIEVNPCGGIATRKEVARERALNDAELRRLFANLPGSGLKADDQDLIAFIALTACRLSEACAATYAEMHRAGDDVIWILPAARSKNRREHRAPLSKQAAALVERRRKQSTRYLFPMADDGNRPMRHDYIHQPLRDALPALGALPFRPHDLRRTAASGIAALGAPRDIVRRILNHVDPTVTARYDRHDYIDELRGWLQRWADHLDTLRAERHAAKA